MIDPIQAMPSLPEKIAFQMSPPTIAPTTPRIMVAIHPIDCLPGRSSRARPPMISPAMMYQTMSKNPMSSMVSRRSFR